MELQPARVDQLVNVRGRWIGIEADVGGVVAQIVEIGHDRGIDLSVRISEATGVFKVVQTIDGEEQLVTSSTTLDGRLVQRIRQVTAPTYDLAAEAEKLEREKDADFWREQENKVGDAAERLAHAFRRDTGDERVSVVVPGTAHGVR